MKFQDLKIVKGAKDKYRDGAWLTEIRGFEVSIIKFNKSNYNGDYEIFAGDQKDLFMDVERFPNKNKLMKRLNELKTSSTMTLKERYPKSYLKWK